MQILLGMLLLWGITLLALALVLIFGDPKSRDFGWYVLKGSFVMGFLPFLALRLPTMWRAWREVRSGDQSPRS